jgi:hypothetical protein
MDQGRTQYFHLEDGGYLFETMVATYETTWHHNPEDHNPHFQCHEYLNLQVTYF